MKASSGKFLILLSLALVIISFQFTPYADYDLWWHLQLGDGMIETGRIYDLDTFSYTFGGKHQTSSEWLSDLIIAAAFKAGGMTGLSLLKAVIILLTLFFMFRTLANRESDDVRFAAAVITVVVVLFALRFRLFVRPYLFNYLFIAVFLHILDRYRASGNLRTLAPLPLLQLAWSNMYSASLFGPLIAGCFLAGTFVDRGRRQAAVGLGAILLAIVGATFISPEGYRAYTILYGISADPTIAKFGEFQPLSFALLWGYGFGYTLAYQVLAAGSLVYFIGMKGWKNLYHVLLFAVFFTESVLHIRMIDAFSIVGALFFCPVLEAVLRRASARVRLPRKAAAAAGAVLLLAIIPASVIGNTTYPFGFGVKEGAFPEKAIAFLERVGITGRLFNSYSFGGYFIWRAPERKVFIDGRYSRPYNADFYNAYRDALEKPEAWDRAEEQWKFDYAVFEYDPMSRQFPLHLNMNPRWALVYWDRISAVYLKRTPQNRKTIEQYEYRVVKPAFGDFAMLEHKLGTDAPDASFLSRIDRDIALNPENQEPRLAKVFLLHKMGPARYQEAYAELEATLRLKPDLAMEHSAAAFLLLRLGKPEQALIEARKAVALDPADPLGLELKKKLVKK